MSKNVLVNPGFNDGHHHQDGIAEIVVPDGWHLYYLDGEPFPGIGDNPDVAYRPESVVWNIKGAPEHEKTLFFLDGEYCLKVFKAWAPVYFALTQHVKGLTPGAKYRFNASVFPDIVKTYSGSKKVYATDIWSAEARAGFSEPGVAWPRGQDPSGGQGIEWSSWFNKHGGNLEFGKYGDVWVEFVAPESGEARVWLECKAKWGLQNNWFMDAFEMVEVEPSDKVAISWSPAVPRVGDEVEVRARYSQSLTNAKLRIIQPDGNILNRSEPQMDMDGVDHLWTWRTEPVQVEGRHTCEVDSDTVSGWASFDVLPTEDAGKCENRARFPYDRTYLLLPEDATREEALAAFERAFEEKWTMGYDRDDAFIGCGLKSRTVVVPHNRFPDDIREFGDTFYPGAEVIIEDESGPSGPSVTPPPRKTRGHFGPHVQGMRDGVLEFIERVKPPVVKIFGAGDVFSIKERSPDTAVVFRHWMDAGDQASLLGMADKHEAARQFIGKFSDVLDDVVPRLKQLYPQQDPVLYIESVNEEYECNHPKNANTAAFDIALMEVLAETGLPVAASVFTAAQGNPEIEGPDLDVVLELGRHAMQHRALMGYHNYWGANIDMQVGHLLEEAWPWSPGRWQLFDDHLTAHGVYVTWFGGETGPCTSENGWSLDAGGGWLASGCHNGEFERCLQEIMLFDEMVREWNETHDDRYLGGVLFTTGPGGWGTFQYLADQWQQLGDAMIARYG